MTPPSIRYNEVEYIDLAYIGNGGVAVSFSDEHFGSAENLLLPDRGKNMLNGWETKRSREPNHSDWIIIQLGYKSSYIHKIIIDTAHYRGNFPQCIMVHDLFKEGGWIELVSKSKTGPDKIHEYIISKKITISKVKLTIIPDGGVEGIRVMGK